MAFSPEANKPKELIEIEEHFERVGLPSEAAQALTDPGSDFNYSSLPLVIELVMFEDPRGVKLQVLMLPETSSRILD